MSDCGAQRRQDAQIKARNAVRPGVAQPDRRSFVCPFAIRRLLRFGIGAMTLWACLPSASHAHAQSASEPAAPGEDTSLSERPATAGTAGPAQDSERSDSASPQATGPATPKPVSDPTDALHARPRRELPGARASVTTLAPTRPDVLVPSRGLELARTERRVALVIGNGDYADLPLRNPRNDAKLMASALEQLGFDVVLGLDLDLNAMRRAIRSFGRALQMGGVGLFYYAGHAMQVQGSNFLIPVGSQVMNEDDVSAESVNVGEVLARMAGARNRLNLVILDACRNNPFERGFRSTASGLAQMKAPTGTLIAYATAPGSVASDGGPGDHGIYTEALSQEMQRPGVQVEDVFKAVRERVFAASSGRQVPWESSSIIGDFYFNMEGVSGAGMVQRGSFERISNADSKVGWPTYVVGGAGVAALAAGAVLGVLAMNNMNQAEQLCPAEMRSEASGCDDEAVGKSQTALLQANLSNVGFGVGVVGLGVATYLWLTDHATPTSEHAGVPRRLTVRPMLSLHQARLTLEGSL